MEVTKKSVSTTRTYTIVDGPVMDTDPRFVTAQFTVEVVSVTYLNGKLDRAYARGPSVTVPGRLHHRALTARNIPGWMKELESDQKEEA